MPNKISPTSRRFSFIIGKSACAFIERKAEEKRMSTGHLIRCALETVYPEILELEKADATEAPLSPEETQKIALLREVLENVSTENLADMLYRGSKALPTQKKLGRPSKSEIAAKKIAAAKTLIGAPKNARRRV